MKVEKYQVILVTKDRGVTHSWVVVNVETKQIQSWWKTNLEAKQTAVALSTFAAHQEVALLKAVAKS